MDLIFQHAGFHAPTAPSYTMTLTGIRSERSRVLWVSKDLARHGKLNTVCSLCISSPASTSSRASAG